MFVILLTLNACGSQGTAAPAKPSESSKSSEMTESAKSSESLEASESSEPASSAYGVTSSETQAASSQADTSGDSNTEVSEPATSEESSDPLVYFTSDISAEGLVRIYETLGWEPQGKPAVKISTGEPPASNYLRPELIGDLVKTVDGTIVECNTAYGGSRSSTAMHKQVAEDHGFTAIADFDLMDEDGEVEWPMTGGSRLDKVIVGSHAENYSDWIILSHFKGHMMAGYGGAIKNVGIGISSPSGKVYVHTAGTQTSGSICYNDQDAWLEASVSAIMWERNISFISMS